MYYQIESTIFKTIFYFFKVLLIFILERKSGGRRAERDPQADSTLSAEPDMGLDLTNPRSRIHPYLNKIICQDQVGFMPEI